MTKSENNKSIYFTRDKLIWGCCLKPNEKLVLHCLNSFMGKDDKCWPAQQRIADMTSISRKTVINILQGLEAQGVIRTHQRTRASGGKSSKDYFVDWETLEFFQGKRPKGKLPMCKQVTSRCEESTHGQCEESSQLLTTHSFVKDHFLTNQGNIDSVSGENADSTDELTGNLSNEGGNKTIDSTSSGTASPGNNPDSCGASENDSHSQNEKIEPPVKRWNLDVPIAVDSEGYIKFPPMKNVDPVIKPKFAQVLRKVYRETQFHVVEEWIDSDNISIDEDEDGEIVICDKNGDWTEEEAFGQGGCLPLRLLRNIAATDEYSGFSADAYNQFIVDRFNYHWNRR